MAVTPSIRFPPAPLGPRHHLAQEEAWPEAGELWHRMGVPVHLPLHFRAVIQHFRDSASPLPLQLSTADWAFLGSENSLGLSYLSPCKSWVSTAGNSCFGLARDSSSSSSASSSSSSSCSPSLQVTGAGPDFCCCAGAELGRGREALQLQAVSRPYLSAGKRVPEEGSTCGL